MIVAMVQVGVVRMLVAHRRVMMPMGMRHRDRIVRAVVVAMMVVVDMTVLVVQRVVEMAVFMGFGHMKIQAEPHQDACDRKPGRYGLAEHGDGEHGTDEWRRGEIGAGACRAQMAQGEHEEHQADAIAKKTDRAGTEDGW